ncbi:MAG: alkaline phosphatase family protein [Acidimicrobiia bacterium]|nr:alkaline phosphatase family protein [Acidimicrobiia bacterium]
MILHRADERNGLVHLVGELEARLTGSSTNPGLDPAIARLIPGAASYLMVLFDGLGDRQLPHPAAWSLLESRQAVLQAPFPTTTTVSLATIATGHPVNTHGLIGHLMWVPELNKVVNTLKWVDLTGASVGYDTRHWLPTPNLWERLGEAGVEPVTVQPAEFAATPLTDALYRGCRFVGFDSAAEFVARSLAEVSIPGRLVFAYWPPIDYAAHVWGQGSDKYHQTLEEASEVWEGLRRNLPREVTLIGTADHGLVDVPQSGKQLIRDQEFRMLDFWGDSRALMVRGSRRLIDRLHHQTGSELIEADVELLWGSGESHPQLAARMPHCVLLAPPRSVLLPPGFDKRLVGYHGGLTEEEVDIPLLVGSG